MSPLDAVAAALRERLLAGRPAPLPGLGTLVRQHVPARVEERADGTRVLLPPGETIGLGPAATGDDSLAHAFAAFRGLPEADADARYAAAMDQVEAVLAATGEVRLVGVGLLRRTSGGVVLGVEADLLAAVNRRYEGLAPVETAPRPAPLSLTPVPGGHSAKRPVAPPAAPAEEPAPIAAPLAPDPEPPSSPADAAFDEAPASSAPIAELSPLRASEPLASSEPEAPALTRGDEPKSASAEVDDEPLAAPFRVPDPHATAPEVNEPAPDPEPTDPFRPSAEAAPAAASLEPDATDPFRPEIDATPPASDETSTEEEPPTSDVPDPAPSDDPAPLAVPFGAPDAPPLADVLPPTPHGEPDPAPEATAAALPADDWTGETWAAPDVSAPLTDDFGAGGSPIEEADFDVVDTEADLGDADPDPFTARPDEPAAFAAPVPSVPETGIVGDLADAPEQPLPPGAPTTAVPIEVVSPVADLGASPDAADLEPVPAPPAERRARVWPWVLLILLVAAAAAAVLFWDQIAAVVNRPAPGATYTATADGPGGGSEPTVAALPIDTLAGPFAANGAPLPDSILRAGEARTVDTGTEAAAVVPAASAPRDRDARPTRPAAASRDDDASASTQPALGRAPAANVALLPPRLAGLPADDRSALSGDGSIDPDAAGFSLVVLSTPARTEAEPLVVRWRRAGYRAAVLTAAVGGRAMYRVVVGQFTTREQALRLRDRVGPQAPADTWLLDLSTL